MAFSIEFPIGITSFNIAALSRSNRMQVARATSSQSVTVENLAEGRVHASRIEHLKGVMMSKMMRDHDHGGLVMIDAIQRLALDHHFSEEIQEMLHNHHNRTLMSPPPPPPQPIHEAALSFRLLRQHGYHMPDDVFKRFKDMAEDEQKNMDTKGLMALYEASQLGVDGEDILFEVEEFTSQLLKGMEPLLKPHLAGAVRHTLLQPHHKSIPRFLARHFMDSNYQEPNSWIYELQDLAKLDFNIVQSLHQTELQQVSRWWKELGLGRQLGFVRDQPIKWYTWSLALIEDPNLSNERVQLTKAIAMIYVIDDIFDVYGTLDELTLFSQALDRWDDSVVEQLPEYMKICFRALDDITNEINHKVKIRNGWNPTCSIRKTWRSLCNAFLVEAKWYHLGTLPGPEEYLENGIISSGVHVALVHLFFLLGHNLNKNTVDQIETNPRIISSAAMILRLWDDLGSAQDENQEGNDGSYIECYLKEHDKGGAEEVERAREHVRQRISDAWKRLNRECLHPNPFSASAFARGCLNLARMVPLLYDYDQEHNLPYFQDFIKATLYEPAVL